MKSKIQTISDFAAMPLPGATRGRRGLVLLLVLSMLAVAGILAYAILAASALDAQSAAHARATVQAESMAENGVNLAMHYLLHPDDSPVALVQGPSGDWHYPGQSNIAVDEDKFSVTVTNLAPATFQIESIGQSRDADGNACTRRLRVRVVGIGDWKALGALQSAADLALDAEVTVLGDLINSDKFDGGGVVTGMRRASNYESHSTDPVWAAPPQLPELTVPRFASLNLVSAVTQRSGYYAYNDARCRVDYITSNPLLTPPTPSAGNAGRVFVYTGSSPLTLKGGSLNDFQGTLVVTQAPLVIQNHWKFNPQNKMPALLVAGTSQLWGAAAAIEVNGVFFNGGGFADATTLHVAPVIVNGVMLSGVSTPSTLGDNIAGPLKLSFDSAKADVPDLTTQGIRYARLQIEDWEQVN